MSLPSPRAVGPLEERGHAPSGAPTEVLSDVCLVTAHILHGEYCSVTTSTGETRPGSLCV